MRLRNAGLIFDIRKFEPFQNFTHAQSPQLFQIGDINRIYFSARPKVRDGLLPTTKVLYVDYDADFGQIIDFSRDDVISPAILGAYDEHGIFPFHVSRIHGRTFGYISGWSRRVSVPVETAIGVSESLDSGKTFQRLGDGPILSSSLHEPFLVGDPFIVANKNEYLMYYIAGTEWKATELEKDLQRIYKIRMASSLDGQNWEPRLKNIIIDTLGPNECQALPSLVKTENISIMAFCYREMSNFRQNGNGAYQIGFATSSDLSEWNRNDSLFHIEPHQSKWDDGMRCYPNINILNDRLHIIYNGNDFGRNGFGLAVAE